MTTEVYTVEKYLSELEDGDRSPKTVSGYRKIFKTYAWFLSEIEGREITTDEIHNYLTAELLLKYAGHRKRAGMSASGTKVNLSVLRRFFETNGVVFSKFRKDNISKRRVEDERNNKPLDMETVRKMMDLSDPHMRSVLTFLVSSGARAGETCDLRLSDVGRIEKGRFVPDIGGDVVCIPNSIAKNGNGGLVFLTAEAREYLTLWLKDRDGFIRIADARVKGLATVGATRPKKDDRLFAISYAALHKKFTRLYMKVDGEKGKYHNAITIHSTRRTFRTLATRSGGMSIDLVEGIMRHTGYLSQYVNMKTEDRQAEFKAGETSLYVTRPDHRIQSGKLSQLEREKDALQARLTAMEERERASKGLAGEYSYMAKDPEFVDAVAKQMLEIQKQKK